VTSRSELSRLSVAELQKLADNPATELAALGEFVARELAGRVVFDPPLLPTMQQQLRGIIDAALVRRRH
jgi:hypothetical protein